MNFTTLFPNFLMHIWRKLQHDPRHYFSVTAILALCSGILLFSAQLNYRIFIADMPHTDAKHIYQLNLNQSQVEIAGIGMAGSKALDELHYRVRNVKGDLVSQQPTLTQFHLTQDLQVPVAEIRVSENYSDLFDLTTVKGSGLDQEAHKVLISYQVWEDVLAKRLDIIGGLFKLGNRQVIVAGVLADEVLLPNTLSLQNMLSSLENKHFVISQRNALAPAQAKSVNTQLQLSPVDVFFRTTLPVKSVDELFTSTIRQINANSPGNEALSFELTTLRKGVSGAWYIFAPITLAGSLFIFFIGFVAICNLVLVKAGKEQKHMRIELIIGASKSYLFYRELVEYALVCVFSLAMGATLSASIAQYIGNLFQQSGALFGPPAFGSLAFVSLFLCVTIALLLKLSAKTINDKKLSEGINSGGKNAQSSISLPMLKKLTGYQVFSMSTLLILGMASFVSSTYQMLPLLNAQFDRVSAIAVEFAHGNVSKAEQARIIEGIHKNLLSHSQAQSIGLSSGDPFFLTSSYSKCQSADRTFSLGRMYADTTFLTMVNAQTVQGSLDAFANQIGKHQIVINTAFARQYFGNTSAVVGRSVNCKKITGTVAAVVDLNRIVHPLLQDLMSQDEPIAVLPFDWATSPTMLSDVPHLLINHASTSVLTQSNVDGAFAPFYGQVKPAKIVNLSQQLDEQGKQPRLALFISSLLVFTFVVLAISGLWGSLSLQIRLRRTELAVYQMLGMPKKALLLHVFKDNKKQTGKLLLASLFLSVWFAFLLGIGSDYKLEAVFAAAAILLILLVSSIAPVVSMLRSRAIKQLLS